MPSDLAPCTVVLTVVGEERLSPADFATVYGATDWADRFTRAIEDGFTATEILMALRHNLGDLLATGPQLDEDLRGFVVSLHADINSALA
jgi:hypothetical protein